ncbi:hypothetical protein MMC25_005984 [Agyrium rufum]|nr:hypothetical protein [Agyrium rufum]
MTRTAATAVTSVGLRAPTRSGNVIEVRTNSDGSRDLEERRSVLDALRRKHGASKSPSSPALESYEERERKERAAAVLDSWERMAMIGLGTGESIPQTRLRYQRKLTNTADPPRTKPTTTLPTSPNSNRVRSSPSGKSVGAAAISTPKPTRKKASSNITSPPQDPQASSPQQSNSNSSPSASSAQDYESEYEESYEATMKIVLEREAVERKRRWDEEERKYNERMEKKERKEREAREQEEREARVARVAKGKEKRDVIGVDVEMGDADQEGEEEDEVLLQGRRRISAGGGALRVERRSLPGGSGGGGGGSLKREKRKKNDVRAGR